MKNHILFIIGVLVSTGEVNIWQLAEQGMGDIGAIVTMILEGLGWIPYDILLISLETCLIMQIQIWTSFIC